MIQSISLERLQQIEAERVMVQSDLAYQQWVRELGVSSSYVDRSPIHRANDMMGSYSFGKKDLVDSGFFRIFTK